MERSVISRLNVYRLRNVLRVHHSLHHNSLEKNSNANEGSVLLVICCSLISSSYTKSCLQAPHYIWALLFPKNPFTTNLKLSHVAFSSLWRNLSKYSSLIRSRICGPMTIHSFNFASLSLGNYSSKWVKAASSWFVVFTKIFIRLSFKFMDGNKILLSSSSGWFSTFMSRVSRDFLAGQSFIE